MIRKTLLLMSFLSLFGCGASHAPEFPTDTFTARDGSQFTMTFIKHGSLAIEVEAFDFDCHVMMPGDTARPRDYVTIEAVAAYNTSADRQQYHPRERQDVGYLLTIGGTRIYVSGDGENTPEMEALRDIDIALLAVNQPFTMTVDQAVEAAKAIRPKIFYPYHYGEVDEKTDLDRLTRTTARQGARPDGSRPLFIFRAGERLRRTTPENGFGGRFRRSGGRSAARSCAPPHPRHSRMQRMLPPMASFWALLLLTAREYQ